MLGHMSGTISGSGILLSEEDLDCAGQLVGSKGGGEDPRGIGLC